MAVCLGYKPVPRDGAIIFADLIGKFDLLRGLGDVPEIPEHLVDGHLTSNEREWLRAFIQRWNAACDRERASAVAA